MAAGDANRGGFRSGLCLEVPDGVDRKAALHMMQIALPKYVVVGGLR